MHFTCFIFNIDFYRLSLIFKVYLYIYMDLKICVSMDFFYSINLCSCTYMRVLSSLYILNIASFVKGRALIKTCPSCIHTSCLVFFIFIWLGVFFLSVKPFAIKLHQRDVNCFLNIFLFCFCFSLNTFQTHAAFNSLI